MFVLLGFFQFFPVYLYILLVVTFLFHIRSHIFYYRKEIFTFLRLKNKAHDYQSHYIFLDLE